MNKTVVKILLGILLFFYIYNPPLIFFPLNSGIIIGGICFVFFLARLLVQLSLSKEIKLNRRILAIAGIISLLVLYSCLIPVLMGSADFQLAKNYLSFLLFHLPGAFGITELFKKHISITTALKIFVSVTALQAIIMIAMLVNPDIKNFFFSILRDADARLKQNQVSGGFRFLGFALGGSWDLSIVQSLGIMSIALLAKTGWYKINLKTALLFLLLLVSVFLAGRTGIIGILLALILLLVPVKATEVPFYKITKLLVMLCLVTVPLFFFIRSKIPDSVADILQTKFLPWAVEMFQNENGAFLETRSSNETKTMYFMPPPKTVLLGDGYYINQQDPGRYYMDTDAGYMRHMLFYGVIGSFLQIFFYLLLFYQIYQFSYAFQSSPAARLFVIFTGIYFFISHLKGDLLGGADMPLKTLFFIYAVLISFSDKQKKSASLVNENNIQIS